jgi:predicted nucleic acid-binding protein
MRQRAGIATVKWMLDTDTCIAIIKKHPIALKKLRGKSIGLPLESAKTG